MKIIAHRGFSGVYPENTMLAFEKAEEAGCDEIELDVHLTKDKVLVIIHDELIDRTTDGTGFVRDYTYKELTKFNASALFEKKFGFNKIPSFDEYCLWVKDKSITTNIEIKTNKFYYEEIEKELVDKIYAYGLEKKVMFSSFNFLSLVKCKEIAPEIECGLLSQNGIENAGYLASKYHFECYHPDVNSITDEIVRNCKEHEVKMNVWTVNDGEGLHKLYDWDCNGIITNYPDICRGWLNFIA